MTKLNKAPVKTNVCLTRCENCVHFDKTAHTWKKVCTITGELVNCWDKCEKFERRVF